jgi:hypothetical protein
MARGWVKNIDVWISPVVKNHRLTVENPHSGFDVYRRRILSDGEGMGKEYQCMDFAGG